MTILDRLTNWKRRIYAWNICVDILSDPGIDRFIRKWAPSAVSTYNKKVNDYTEFCESKKVLPSMVSLNRSIVAAYLLESTKSSVYPKNQLNIITAALNLYYKRNWGPITNICRDDFIEGLVKSGTSEPMQRCYVETAIY